MYHAAIRGPGRKLLLVVISFSVCFETAIVIQSCDYSSLFGKNQQWSPKGVQVHIVAAGARRVVRV